MERDPTRLSDHTADIRGSIEQKDSFEEISLAKDIVKKHSDHDLKADDNRVKEKEMVNIDVDKGSVSAEETELELNNGVQRIGSQQNDRIEKNKSADDQQREKSDHPVSEITVSEKGANKDQDSSVGFEDKNCDRRPVMLDQGHYFETHKTVHSEDYQDYINLKVKIGNTDVTVTQSNNDIYISVGRRKMDIEVLNSLRALKFFFQNKSHFPGYQPVLPFQGIKVQGSSSIMICNPQLCHLIHSAITTVLRMQADQVLLEVTSATEWKRCYICAHKAFFLIAQSQGEVSLQLHTMESLILVTWSPSFNMVTVVYGQPQITITHIYDQGSSSLVMRRQASTVPNQSHDSMVLPSGENADEMNPPVAEQSSSSQEVRVKHKDLKEHQQKPPDIKRKVSEDQDKFSSDRKLHTRKSMKEDGWKWKCILKEKLEPDLEDTGQLSVNNSQMNRKEGDYGFISFFKDIRQRHIKIPPFQKVYAYLKQLNSSTNYLCPINYMCYVYVVELVPRHFIRQSNNYQNENSMIATFPIHFENRVRLAQAGFVYDAATDTVVCPWCGILVDIRDLAEDPVNLHSPTCEFRVRNHEVNIPVATATSSPARPVSDLNVLPALVQPDSRQSTGRYESNVTSEQLLRASDGSNNAPLPDAEFSHSDIRCRDEDTPSGLQTDVGGYVSGLSLPPITAHAAGEQPFQIDAPRSAHDEQLHADNGINNKPTSPVNLHKGGSDARSVELPAVGSPSETLMNPSGGIADTEQWSSGRGKNEIRVDETCIQRISSAYANSVEEPQPKHLQYAVKNMRINSYQGWPAELHQRPEQMAECGFYYEGLALAPTVSHLFPIGDPSGPLTRLNDCVHCFHCGVGMRQWIREDDPWIEHVRWSPKCLYVHKMKGPTFVQRAVEMIQRSAATKNGEENDSSENNAMESADDKNKDAKDEDEEKETTNEREPSNNPEMMRENQELKEATICKICYDGQLCVIFLPCGHMVTCANCSHAFLKCPVCRALIMGMVNGIF